MSKENDFPTLCSSCTGEGNYMRMIKRPMGDECKMCCRVFNSFNWKRDKESRYMKTVICNVCSSLKNLCQSCVLDFDFQVPAYVRDSILPEQDQSGVGLKHEVTSMYEAEQVTRTLDPSSNGRISSKISSDTILRLIRSKQKDVAQNSSKKKLIVPEDKKIKTLYVSGLNGGQLIEEEHLKANFSPYGEIKSIKIVRKQDCAFITFENRQDAEIAAESLFNKLIINESPLKLLWAKPKSLGIEPYQKEEKFYEKTNEKPDRLENVQKLKKQEIRFDPSKLILPKPPGEEDEFVYPSMKPSIGAPINNY
jgi:pre-mRNA-splicing factor RBM22/SLT11